MTMELVERKEATLQTASLGGANILLSWSPPDNSVFLVRVFVVARCAANGNSAAYFLERGFKRHSGGNPATLGSLTKRVYETVGTSDAYDANISIVLANLEIHVDDGGVETVEWMGILEAYLYQP